jgi:hypothetical protein
MEINRGEFETEALVCRELCTDCGVMINWCAVKQPMHGMLKPNQSIEATLLHQVRRVH